MFKINVREQGAGGKRFALVHPQPPKGGFKKKMVGLSGKSFDVPLFKSPLGDLGVSEGES